MIRRSACRSIPTVTSGRNSLGYTTTPLSQSNNKLFKQTNKFWAIWKNLMPIQCIWKSFEWMASSKNQQLIQHNNMKIMQAAWHGNPPIAPVASSATFLLGWKVRTSLAISPWSRRLSFILEARTALQLGLLSTCQQKKHFNDYCSDFVHLERRPKPWKKRKPKSPTYAIERTPLASTTCQHLIS